MYVKYAAGYQLIDWLFRNGKGRPREDQKMDIYEILNFNHNQMQFKFSFFVYTLPFHLRHFKTIELAIDGNEFQSYSI